jgi:tetratricopeptide (TPR) repeat protein
MRALVLPWRVAATALVVLGSCASTQTTSTRTAPAQAFAPDMSARAPQLTGFGESRIEITTRSAQAARLFNEGVLQAYAFNEVESIRQFKAALAADKDCAMCAWGVAWQLGPNINDTGRGRVAEANKYLDHALKRSDAATPRERALLQALALRYAHASQARETAPLTAEVCGPGRAADRPDPLDAAYAERMRGLADAYPQDPDVLSLYAEAEMIATQADALWDAAGKPAGRIGEVTARVEKLLGTQASHTGLNHYLVHLTDAQPVAARGVAAADRLAKLAPNSPHLVHMPSHTYVHVGRFVDAARVNEQAVAADIAIAQQQKAQGFTVSKDWRGHNLHFLWYAALMAGREDSALAAAAQLEAQAGRSKDTYAEYLRSLRSITLVRTERWERILAEPQPKRGTGLGAVFSHYARGMAQARLGKLADAQASFKRLISLGGPMRAQASGAGEDGGVQAMLDYAEFGLQAEIAATQRRFDDAIVAQRKAIESIARLDAREPPMFADGTRLALGSLQLRAGRWADAEATYRTALAEHPGSGWALRGLVQSLAAQGRKDEAQAARGELDRAWSAASGHLRS